MTGHEWEPGTVAVVEIRERMVAADATPSTYLAFYSGYDKRWISAKSGGLTDDGDRWSVTYRPLAVIDPEDRGQVDRLLTGYYDQVRNGVGHNNLSDALEAALHEFSGTTPKPPKPDEPYNYMAVVQTADGKRYWRWSAGVMHTGHPWRLLGAVHADTEACGNFRYDDLTVVDIVSEGVPA